MKKRIATITFHASYNYGSNLQAYALQEYIKKISKESVEYKIINLRTNTQKEMYKTFFEKRGIKNRIKSVLFFYKKKSLMDKKKLFEKFLKDKLNTTKEYCSLEELKNEKFEYDYFIAGSDQLWNLQAKDFDWANFLEFVNHGKKISYAASLGPKQQNLNCEDKKRIKEDLLKFDHISVRENGSYNTVKEITGKEVEINIDPTMLLNRDEWEALIPHKAKYDKKDYIFLYNLKGSQNMKLAKKISKELGLPIVISNYRSIKEINMGMTKIYDIGPVEFLNLIKNAKLVLSSSYHGTIFSILLHRPFFALNGNKDFRINTLLEKLNLSHRSIEIENYKKRCEKAFEINFEESEKRLNTERKKSENYLKKALDIKD